MKAAPLVRLEDLINLPTCHRTARTLDNIMHPTKSKLICRASEATSCAVSGIVGNKAANRAIR
jgi:transcriptional regulator of met regulon